MILALLLVLFQAPDAVYFIDVEAPLPTFIDATDMAQRCANHTLPFDSVTLYEWDTTTFMAGQVTATGDPGCAWELAQAHDVVTCVNLHPCYLEWIKGWPGNPVFQEY